MGKSKIQLKRDYNIKIKTANQKKRKREMTGEMMNTTTWFEVGLRKWVLFIHTSSCLAFLFFVLSLYFISLPTF